MSDRDKTLKIYLAGKMSGLSFDSMNEWRKRLKETITMRADLADYKVVVINPVDFFNFEEQRHKSEEEVMDYDLHHVETSDICVVNISELNTSIGTCIELYMAWQLKIPVIAFGNIGTYENLHPWIKRCISRYEETQLLTANYIRDFYMI